MISRLFPAARRAILRPKVMYFGMLLACFAWLLQLTPLLAPLWLKELYAGHGICVELAPAIAAKSIRKAAPSHHHLTNSALRQPSKPPKKVSKPQKYKAKVHDCQVCLAMMALSLPVSGADLIVFLLLAFAILAAVLYRSLCQRLIIFLRPPSRASPNFH